MISSSKNSKLLCIYLLLLLTESASWRNKNLSGELKYIFVKFIYNFLLISMTFWTTHISFGLTLPYQSLILVFFWLLLILGMRKIIILYLYFTWDMKPRRIRHIKCCNVMSDRKWLFKIATVQGSLVYGRVIRNFVGPMWKTEIIMVRMGLLTPYFECRNQMKPIICCGFISELLLARARDKSCLPLSYSIQFVWFISNTLHEVISSKTAQSLDHHGILLTVYFMVLCSVKTKT